MNKTCYLLLLLLSLSTLTVTAQARPNAAAKAPSPVQSSPLIQPPPPALLSSPAQPASPAQPPPACDPTITRTDYTSTGSEEGLTIYGTNFSPYKEDVQVTIGGVRVNVVSSDVGKICVAIPSGLPEGGSDLVVTVKGKQSKAVKARIKVPPEVTGLSVGSASPGMLITVYGSHFAEKASDNKVTIGGLDAPIVSGSSSYLIAQMPLGLDAVSPSWGLPVVVQAGKLKSNDSITINVQMRVW